MLRSRRLNGPVRKVRNVEPYYVHSTFVGMSINPRKLFPAALRGVLAKNQATRDAADYRPLPVNPIQAIRAVERAEQFVSTVERMLQKGSQ